MKKLALLSIVAMLFANCASKPVVKEQLDSAADLQNVVNTISDAFSMAKSEVGNKKIKLKSADVAFSTTKSKTISGGISIVVAANGEFKKENNQKITYSLVDADAAKLNANPKAASNLSKLIVSAANSFISLAVPENLGLKKDSFEIELEIIITKSGDGGIEITLFDALELSAKGAYERAVGNTITLTFEIQ